MNSNNFTSSISCRGVTLIECLVSLLIIGLLLGILLPAIFSAREAGRMVQCSNNLRQIGIAIISYESTYQLLPPGNHSRGFSFLSAILPYLDNTQLFNSINFTDSNNFSINYTASHSIIATFSCPSDTTSASSTQGRTSYAGNRGVGFAHPGVYGHKDNGAIAALVNSPIGFRDIIDGSMCTSMVAEWVSAGDRKSRNPKLITFLLTPALRRPEDFEIFANNCAHINLDVAKIYPTPKGNEWLNGNLGRTLYNHTLTINGNSCMNGTRRQQSAWTAGSQHRGGAHTLFADGHSRFLSESMSLITWRSIGTRNGGESISADSY